MIYIYINHYYFFFATLFQYNMNCRQMIPFKIAADKTENLYIQSLSA